MKLYFLRHGIAADREHWEPSRDHLRPLTTEGIEKTDQIAKTLDKLKVEPDVILTSPLLRAKQTAEIVASRLDKKNTPVETAALSPGFSVRHLEILLKQYPNAKSMLLVGHEPDFSETVGELTGGSRIVFKKGGFARVDLTSLTPPRGELCWLLQPHILTLDL